jgi:hypothetical protein
MTTIPQVDSDYVKEIIDGVREQIGKPVSVYTPIKSACNLCTSSGYYDSFSDHSIYFTCPECKGSFWKNTLTVTVINARVHWTANEAIGVTAGGKYFSGDASLHVDPEYHTLFQDSMNGGKVVVDNQEMNVIRINPLGAPTLNRYRIILRGGGKAPQG